MFQKPKTAKRLYFDVIPRAVDDYLQFLAAYPGQDAREQLDNPVWHIHAGEPPAAELPVTFGAAAQPRRRPRTRTTRRCCGASSAAMSPGASAAGASAARPARRLRGALLRRLREADEALPRADEVERQALAALSRRARQGAPGAERRGAADHRLRRRPLRPRYQDSTKGATPRSPASPATGSTPSTRSCSARAQGPRFGSFIELYGIAETRALIDKALKGELDQGRLSVARLGARVQRVRRRRCAAARRALGMPCPRPRCPRCRG